MAQRVWCRRYGLLQVLVVLSSAMAAVAQYRLVPPALYVVFGGDLYVNFSYPSNVSLPSAFVRLRGQHPGQGVWHEVTTLHLPQTRTTGRLTAACGTVEFAGSYSLTMYRNVNGPVLTEVMFEAVWPHVTLQLSGTRYVLMSPMILHIRSEAKCRSRLGLQWLEVDLLFQRMASPGGLTEAVRIASHNVTSLDDSMTRHVYPCNLFDLDGAYQAWLRSSVGSTLAVSNVRTLTFSASYHLSSRRSSIFPCAAGSSLEVLYTHPPCSGVDQFRVFRLERQASGSLAAPLNRVYVGEFPAHPDKTGVDFDCALFDPTAVGFCFHYVTASRHGPVVEQKRFCLPSQPHAVLIQDGGWSGWTSWTECSVTCGWGKQSRFRICNSPRPEPGGLFCKGHNVQWTSCNETCPASVPRTPLHSPRFDPTCYCGCTRTTDSGEIIGSGRCSGLATWLIRPKHGQQVTLTFRYFDISYQRQWVKVRDGELPSDELLFFSHAPSPPRDVTSSSNVMRVELMTQMWMTSPVNASRFQRNASLPIHVRGFVATYSVTASEATPPPLFRRVRRRLLQSDVALLGLALGPALLLALCLLVVVHRRYWRHPPKYAPAGDFDPDSPQHVPLSAQSSQPSSPGPQVHVDMDIPLTGGGNRRKSSSGQPRAASRASSISSTCSAGLKKVKAATTPSGGGGGMGTESPKPSTRDYSNLDSPGSQLASPGDPNQDTTSRLSPLPRHVTPRSPRVHPHRPSPGTPSSPGLLTKHDLLTRKRRKGDGATTPAGDAEGVREVTGSSGSCSTVVTRPLETKTPTPTSITSASAIAKKTPTTASSKKTPTPTARMTPAFTPTFATITPTSSTTRAEIHLAKPPPGRALPKLRSLADSSPSGSGRLRSPAQARSPLDRRQGLSSAGTPADPAEHIPMIGSTAEAPSPPPAYSPALSPSPALCEETTFTSARAKARRPTSLTESYSLDAIASSRGRSRTPRSPGKPSAMEERQTLLPKPDGQSPKSVRQEALGAEKDESSRGSGSSSPDKLSVGGASSKTVSPSRSITTPELEYDDFIMDDPLSYFEYEELGRLNWTGTEKLGRKGPREGL